MIQRLAGVPASHSGIMVTPTVALGARDDTLEVSGRTGRAFWATLDELINHDSIDYVVIRRPPASLDVDAFRSWAIRVGAGVPHTDCRFSLMVDRYRGCSSSSSDRRDRERGERRVGC